MSLEVCSTACCVFGSCPNIQTQHAAYVSAHPNATIVHTCCRNTLQWLCCHLNSISLYFRHMFRNIEDGRMYHSFIPAVGRRLSNQRMVRYRATHKYQHVNFKVFALLSTLKMRIVENDVCCHVVAALIPAQPPHSVHSSPCTLLLF